jgi:hypothetical protein
VSKLPGAASDGPLGRQRPSLFRGENCGFASRPVPQTVVESRPRRAHSPHRSYLGRGFRGPLEGHRSVATSASGPLLALRLLTSRRVFCSTGVGSPWALRCEASADLAGVVVRVGARVKQFKAGDEVYARPADHHIGSFAELIAVQEKDLALKPKRLTLKEPGRTSTLSPSRCVPENVGSHIQRRSRTGGVCRLDHLPTGNVCGDCRRRRERPAVQPLPARNSIDHTETRERRTVKSLASGDWGPSVCLRFPSRGQAQFGCRSRCN